ncbi:hypothetical protein Y032_0432g1344 [Ancylostoma ceylanicum]|uniref:Uncharacterized protein n=1 Tax=Ancylostoma ceylanicum TaxID=53326 RepID=A0A016WZN4_9BILA|nr:hypothetical protein Y032_0432g1344 [Ancylostoma ceylanicum]
MDDDLVDVLIVLGVLMLGVIGLLVLLAMHAKRFRRLFRCFKNEEDTPIKVKRTTIKVVRRAHTITAEEGKSVASKTPVSRVFSSPLPEHGHLPSPGTTKELLFIVPKSPTYKAEMAHSVVSAHTSNSTGSSYLPSQIHAMPKRRCST